MEKYIWVGRTAMRWGLQQINTGNYGYSGKRYADVCDRHYSKDVWQRNRTLRELEIPE